MQRITLLIWICVLISFISRAQSKYNYVNYDKLLEVEGTDYVIASIDDMGKKLYVKSKYMLFINTSNGATRQVDFPRDASLREIKQVKIDSLGINKIVVTARTVNLDKNNSIDWDDPLQVIILSTDGTEKIQVTEDAFFVSTWVVNSNTGTLTITGYFDTNSNGKYDKKDKNEILIYDLKSMKLLATI